MLPALFFVYWGGIPLYILCFAISIVALWEFTGVFKKAPDAPEFGRAPQPSFVICAIGAVSFYGIMLFINVSFLAFWIFLVTVLSLLLLFRNSSGVSDALVTLAANLYIVFFLGNVVLLGTYFTFAPMEGMWDFQGFKNPVWLALLAALGSDIFAYFTGVLIGKHKLCPKLSPKKTVEGFVGGIIGSILLCCVFGTLALGDFFGDTLLIPLPGGYGLSGHLILIGALGGAISVVGDLTASAIKRKLGVKDYGKLIPGHGGIMDRIDSVLFTVPFLFFYLQVTDFIYNVINAGAAA
jgi:phosphatidate cytidylyltransferase